MKTELDTPQRDSRPFRLGGDFTPQGDQPKAIEQLVEGVARGVKHQTLLGVTGSGKTFTMAGVIERCNKPALVLVHNKTLAAQLYQELKVFFPDIAVEYFISYYDYYQPEAYVPSTNTYIEKDSQINEAIDRMRHRATRSLLSRDDVIVVASVSCIFGIGSTESYKEMTVFVEVGRRLRRDSLLRQLVESQYERNDIAFTRGTFRVRGDVVEIFPAHEDEVAVRVSFFGDEVEAITLVDPLRGRTLRSLQRAVIWPSSHHATSKKRLQRALVSIREELQQRLQQLEKQQLLVEAQRLEQRTMHDLEMLESTGMCKGIENYTRHLTGNASGEPPPTLFDYFPKDFLVVVDESHQTIGQVRAMHRANTSRKETLIRHGFRMLSAIDNRPLTFEEFEGASHQTVYLSATPAQYELQKSEGVVVEQVVRPTGLLDPEVEIRPVATQVDDVIAEIRSCVTLKQRVLITTLTKRMAEDLSEYLEEAGIKSCYLHSEIDTLERIEILKQLRKGVFDVVVGINLLREGLDLPEVALVAILDADKEGFLRSATGLIQTIGRAARNVNGRAILYGDRITDSMRTAIDETKRRRSIQQAHNTQFGIIPRSIVKPMREMDGEITQGNGGGKRTKLRQARPESPVVAVKPGADPEQTLVALKKQMQEAAKQLDFEQAAALRDQIKQLEREMMGV